MTNRISAVVLSYNSAPYLESCVRSLSEAYGGVGGRCDAWFVENGSSDASVEILASLENQYDFLHSIRFAENNGTTRSRNAAIQASNSEYVLILDSDATISAECLNTLLSVMDNDSDCGIVVPNITYPDGRAQISHDTFPTITRKLQRFFFLRSMEQSKARFAETRTKVDYAISAVWLVRRRVFQEIGLLDESIFYSPEDVDFCLRVWLGGYTVVCEPSARAVHDAQERSRGSVFSSFALRHVWGLLYYFRKHRYLFRLERIRKRIACAHENTESTPHPESSEISMQREDVYP